MVKLNRIYTKTGDSGETTLGDGKRVPKHALRVAAMGAIDEANAALGVARLHAAGDMDQMLARIQNDLFDVGADICITEDGPYAAGALRVLPAQTERLEREIDAMNESLSPLTSFVLPGGTPLAAYLHLARTIVRRAEISVAALKAEERLNEEVLRYVNRLSDHLFVAARSENAGVSGDVLWTPGQNR
jgi:cob(I)alamin adenosyltransferase